MFPYLWWTREASKSGSVSIWIMKCSSASPISSPEVKENWRLKIDRRFICLVMCNKPEMHGTKCAWEDLCVCLNPCHNSLHSSSIGIFILTFAIVVIKLVHFVFSIESLFFTAEDSRQRRDSHWLCRGCWDWASLRKLHCTESENLKNDNFQFYKKCSKLRASNRP